jgi:hypothetical protein
MRFVRLLAMGAAVAGSTVGIAWEIHTVVGPVVCLSEREFIQAALHDRVQRVRLERDGADGTFVDGRRFKMQWRGNGLGMGGSLFNALRRCPIETPGAAGPEHLNNVAPVLLMAAAILAGILLWITRPLWSVGPSAALAAQSND